MLVMSIFRFGPNYNSFFVLFGLALILFVVFANKRNSKIKKKSNINDLDYDQIVVETDILGLPSPVSNSLVSDTPGIKNPQRLFQLSVLWILIIVAVLALKINTPEPFNDKAQMTREEKKLKFRPHFSYGCLSNSYGGGGQAKFHQAYPKE